MSKNNDEKLDFNNPFGHNFVDDKVDYLIKERIRQAVEFLSIAFLSLHDKNVLEECVCILNTHVTRTLNLLEFNKINEARDYLKKHT